MGTLCVTHWYNAKGKNPPENDPVKPAFLDAVRGSAAKAAALRAVNDNADPVWKRNAKHAIYDLAQTRETFTTDDVWVLLHKRGEETPHEPRALGALMNAAAKKNLIVSSGDWVESNRHECHRRPIRVWRSLIVAAQV